MTRPDVPSPRRGAAATPRSAVPAGAASAAAAPAGSARERGGTVRRDLPGGRRTSRGRRRERSKRRGGFLRKVGCFFGVIIGLMIAASVLGAIFSDERGRH